MDITSYQLNILNIVIKMLVITNGLQNDVFGNSKLRFLVKILSYKFHKYS